MRRATTVHRQDGQSGYISIHALLAESDTYNRDTALLSIISIHALLAESDLVDMAFCSVITVFLSTLSLRRATFSLYSVEAGFTNFYPRSPCGERHPKTVRLYNDSNFYPRSPCGERLMTLQALLIPHYFYPRSPCGERLAKGCVHKSAIVISIHALLAESDDQLYKHRHQYQHISIHALLAESDTAGLIFVSYPITFLSTLSLRRATRGSGLCKKTR